MMGYRLTGLFGLLLIFIGAIVEGFAGFWVAFLANRILVLSLGASLAYTAAHHIS